jgi:hypothetical protein
VDALPYVTNNHYGVTGLMTLDMYGDRKPVFYNIYGYADNTLGYTLYGTCDGTTNTVTWDDEELSRQGVSRPN